MNILTKLSGMKTHIGVIAGAIVGLMVEWSETDALTWDTPWVAKAMLVIAAWTGVAARAAVAKIGK
jgi:hypothetical protein